MADRLHYILSKIEESRSYVENETATGKYIKINYSGLVRYCLSYTISAASFLVSNGFLDVERASQNVVRVLRKNYPADSWLINSFKRDFKQFDFMR